MAEPKPFLCHLRADSRQRCQSVVEFQPKGQQEDEIIEIEEDEGNE
jgi:hypothetical protein